jgi:peroxiredoxin
MLASHAEPCKQEFGQPVSGFSLPLLDGSGEGALQDFLEDKRGAVVAFWSGVCTHCVRYDRYFNLFTVLHPELGFVAIASRCGETREQMQGSVRQRNLRFPILVDSSGEIAQQWHAQQTPRCYLIDADGTLLYRGAIDNFKARQDDEYLEYLEPAITAFLAGDRIARPETASFGCAIQTVYYHLPKQLV